MTVSSYAVDRVRLKETHPRHKNLHRLSLKVSNLFLRAHDLAEETAPLLRVEYRIRTRKRRANEEEPHLDDVKSRRVGPQYGVNGRIGIEQGHAVFDLDVDARSEFDMVP